MRARPSWFVLLLPLLVVLTPIAAASGEPTPHATGTVPGPGGAGNGTLAIELAPSSATLTVNGTTVSVPSSGFTNVSLAPGTYPVRATAPGDEPYQANVTVLSAQLSYLRIGLLPSPAGSSKGPLAPQYLLPIAVTVLGVVGLLGLALFLRRIGPRRAPPATTPPAGSTEGPDEGPT